MATPQAEQGGAGEERLLVAPPPGRDWPRPQQHGRSPNPVVYGFGRSVARAILGGLVTPEVIGLEHVPRHGPLLVVSNHLSFFDSPLIIAALPRRLTFLAQHELFSRPWTGPTLRAMGTLPIQRGARDVVSLRAAVSLLRAGGAIGLFPEGARSRERSLLRGNPGAALLLARSEALVLPMAITGSEDLEHAGRFLTARWRASRVRLVVGRPFRPVVEPGRLDHRAIIDAVMTEVAALLPPAYRGAYLDAVVSTEALNLAPPAP